MTERDAHVGDRPARPGAGESAAPISGVRGVPGAAAERIVSHSLAGTRWMLWLSATALACGFGTNVVLGRAGPGLLGFYGFLTLALSLLGTFFVFGGGNVIVNYLPKLAPADKTSFLASYAGVVAVSAVALMAVVAMVPAVPDLVFGDSAPSGAVPYLTLLLPIAVLQMLAWSTLQADLALRTFAVSQALVSSLTFAALVVAGAAGWLSEPAPRRYIVATVLLGNVASVAVAGVRLWRRQLRAWGPARRWLLPEGFWGFSLYFQGGVMVSFLVRSVDQVYVLRELGLVSLGYYRSALVLSQLAGFLLVVTDKGFYSTFCNVEPADHPQLHRRFVRLNSLGTALAGLVLMLFAGELLRPFGESATSESKTLVMLIAGAVLLALPIASVNNSLVTARERMRPIFVNNAAGAVVAVVLYALLGRRFGLVGVGWAFLALQLVMLLLSSITVRRVAGVAFPLGAWAISVASVVIGAGAGSVLDGSTLVEVGARCGVLLAFVPLALLVRLVTPAELKDLVALVVPGRWSPLRTRSAAS